MSRRTVYLWIQAAICILLAALLCASAVSIFREGSARKAENPMESIYTPEIIANKLTPAAPLFLASIALLALGLALGVKDEDAEKPVKDPRLVRDLVVARVVRPSDAMRKERAVQRKLLFTGWGVFALCMAPIALHLANPAHFPERDLEGMFCALVRVLLPWTVVGLGALAVTSALGEKSVLRETEAARTRMKAEKAEGIAPKPYAAGLPKKRGGLQAVMIVVAVVLIVAGIVNGGARDVLYKAITICTECVGLG